MIRELIESDINQINDIYNDCIFNTVANFEEAPVSYEAQRDLLLGLEKPFITYVYEESGVVKGFVSLRPYKNGKVTVSVYIHKDYRGMNIGKELLKTAISYGHQIDEIKMLIAYITSENKPSQRLFENAGFVFAGIIDKHGEKLGKVMNLSMYRLSVIKK